MKRLAIILKIGMVRMNSYDVDVISGATASSQVIKCAVSAALAGGQPK